ncbi:MAG: DUF192 domain-containing protein [Myxococcota bacterium]
MSRLVFACVVALSACQSQGKPPPAPPAPPAKPVEAPKPAIKDVTAQDYVMPKLPHGRVTLVDAFGGKHAVDAEIAATRDQRTRGLMWRTELPEGTGMLFIFDRDDYLSFWMKNTLIPLDMIFIRSDLVIAGIVERAEPKTLSPRTPGPNVQAKYVLEVPSGWASKIGLRAGLKVSIEGAQGITPDD